MSKKKLTIDINSFIYFIIMIGLIVNQIDFYREPNKTEIISAITIVINTAMIALFIIKNYLYTTFKNSIARNLAITTIGIKILNYYLANTLIVNKITMTPLWITLVAIMMMVTLFDFIIYTKLSKNVENLKDSNSEDFRIESKKNVVRVFKDSQEFRKFQFNIFNYLIAILILYITTKIIDFNNKTDIIIYGLVFLISVILTLRYIVNLSKYTEIQWYHYFLSIFSIFIVSLILYFKENLLIFLVFIPLIPVIKEENKARKSFLKE